MSGCSLLTWGFGTPFAVVPASSLSEDGRLGGRLVCEMRAAASAAARDPADESRWDDLSLLRRQLPDSQRDQGAGGKTEGGRGQAWVTGGRGTGPQLKVGGGQAWWLDCQVDGALEAKLKVDGARVDWQVGGADAIKALDSKLTVGGPMLIGRSAGL